MSKMRWTAILLVALVGCSGNPRPDQTQEKAHEWNAPPVRWVSDLGRFDRRHTYNEESALSDRGRWIVFTSHVEERPSRLFLVDVKRDRVLRIDKTVDSGPRRAPGIGRYSIARGILDPGITPDGRFVVFTSGFSNLVRGDRNRTADVFLYDRTTGEMDIVSRSSRGAQANGRSYQPAISANGRFVVFGSRANNLSRHDRDRSGDVFLRDLRKGTTELISVGANGKGNGWSGTPDVSDDGKGVSFVSSATNLVPDDSNRVPDVFVRDRVSDETIRVSVTSRGDELEAFEACESTCWLVGAREASLSANGEVVVFITPANGAVPEDQNYNDDVYAHEIEARTTERVSVTGVDHEIYGPEEIDCGHDPSCAGHMGPTTHSPSVSRDGRLVYFISAASQITDEDDDDRYSGEEVYVRDRVSHRTVAVSRYRYGSIAHSTNWYPGAISAGGGWVTYSNNSIKLDGPKGDRDPNPDVFLQRLPRFLN
jgi:TolB protein